MTDKTIAPTGDYQIGQVIDRGALPVADVVSRVRRIQEVMKAVMHDGTHYGTIPGTPKPSLYQPGAELLCMTFRIAANPRVEDLSTPSAIRYRVTMGAVSQVTGEALGEGVGECSSDETKYRWCRPACDEEFAETPDELKREKWMRGKNGNFKAKQIRTSPADIANTILKMAYKRALISMTRTVLACSDQFAQDLEDLPEEIRENVVGEDQPAKAPIQPPQRKGTPTSEPAKASVVDGPAFERPALTVAKVEPRKYVKDGKENLFYTIHFSDGRKGSTFSESMAKLAAELGNESVPVECVIEPGKKEGTFNLTELCKAQGDGL